MRKLIIDGSVTSGFQRTAMLGLGGTLKTHFGDVSIDGVNLEEDSCRVLQRNNDHTIFALDRQGIPLIEITTGPHIYTPQQAQDAAKQIGNILRSFPETKRGLGTIRQDLNVSIKGGTRIEIKGAQNLKLIPEIVIGEVKRQMVHVSIIEEVKDRKINCENFTDWEIYDVSNIFKKTTSKVILGNLKDKDSKVLAVKLFNFKGILGTQMQDNYRFATEISNKNKSHFPRIKGLFHSDELPNYGITDDEVSNIRKDLELSKDDSFILLAGEEDMISSSLKNILETISEMLIEVPTEVRQVDPKGTITKFLRPMPGSARMYPETDIPDITLTKKYFDDQRKAIPELYDKKLERLKKDFNIEENKIEELLSNYGEVEIKDLIKVSNKSANYIYSFLFDIPKDIKKREKLETFNFKSSLLKDILGQVSKGSLTQNTIRDLFISLYKDKLDEVNNLQDYLDRNNLIHEEVDESEIESKIKEIVDKNSGAPFGALMGICMKEFDGKVDGKKISEILKKLN